MKKVTTKELCDILRTLADGIEARDSLEGNIRYSAIHEGLKPDEFFITGVFRTGNSEGQGSMTIIE